MLSLTSCTITLHQDQLEALVISTCQQLGFSDSPLSSSNDHTNYQWVCHAVQTFLVDLVLREKKQLMNLVVESKDDVEIENSLMGAIDRVISIDNSEKSTKPEHRFSPSSSEVLTTSEGDSAHSLKEDEKSILENVSSSLMGDTNEVSKSPSKDASVTCQSSSTASIKSIAKEQAKDDTHNEDVITPLLKMEPTSLEEPTSESLQLEMTMSDNDHSMDNEKPEETTDESESQIFTEKISGQVVLGGPSLVKKQQTVKVLKKSTSTTKLTMLLGKSNTVKSKNTGGANKDEGKPSFQSPYSSCIISNTVDERLKHSIELPAELSLQCMAREVYVTLLSGIQFARPIPLSEEPPIDSVNQEVKDDMLSELPRNCSLRLLLHVLEDIFVSSFTISSSSIDRLSLLQFWNEICYVTVKKMKKKHLVTLLSPLENQSTESTSMPQLFSAKTVALLLDLLLTSTSSNSQLWHLVFSLLHAHAKFYNKIGGRQFIVDQTKLSNILVHCCTVDIGGRDHQARDIPQDINFGKFLLRLASMTVVGQGERTEEEEERGVIILFNVLVKVLQSR